MSIRRRTLLEMLLENYQTVSFDNVYHSLINVGKNKGKLKLSKISGNGVIENQQVKYTNSSETINGITFTNNNNGSWTISGTASADATKVIGGQELSQMGVVGHKVLVFGNPSNSSSTTYGLSFGGPTIRWYSDGIYEVNANNNFTCVVKSGTAISSPITFFPQIVDLTLMFGTGNEPTTLTDNRIQAILNRGYIPFNEGTYKCSSVGLITSEPYNLFDGEYQTGYYDGSNGIYNNVSGQLCSKNYIKVVPNESYSCDLGNNSTYWRVCWYDKNKVFISSTAQIGGSSVIAPSNAYFSQFGFGSVYGGIYNNDVSFHRTGTRTGYAPHQSYLPSLYQECEYIESSGTQYIDTGVIPTNTTGVSINFMQLPVNDAVSVGAYTSSSQGGVRFQVGCSLASSTTGTIYGGFNSNDSSSDRPVCVFNENFNEYKLNFLNNRKRIWNGTEYTPIDGTLLTSTNSIFIFGRNDGSLAYPTKIKLKSLQISDGTTIIRNFVPCYRKTDGTIGLFDLVEQKFYTNQGTGVFTKGNDVNHINNEITIPAILDLDGAINSHNTLEVLSDSYRWTRNVWDYTFNGSESWTEQSNLRFYTNALSSIIKAPTISTEKANCLMAELMITNQSSLETQDNAFDIDTNGNFKIRSTSNVTTERIAQSYMTGKTVHYELATPQVISIPKKHLGVVDLGTLVFNTPNVYGRATTNLPISNPKLPSAGNVMANMYCSKFMTYTADQTYGSSGKDGISMEIDGKIDVKDPSFIGLTGTQVAEKLSGIYLFYETQDEVDDFNIKALCEKGGAINTSMFSWVENQIVGNGNFANGTNGWTAVGGTVSASNNIATITPNTIHSSFRQYVSDVIGHKYLYSFDIKYANGEQYYVNTLNITSNNTGTGNWEHKSGIITCPQDTNSVFNFYDYDNNIRSTWYLKNVMLIDLTLGFGAGNEPTSINDPRIQKIIEMGYIPTDTSGTVKNVQNSVLANLEVKIQS